jgi:hypothetical protein
MAQNPDTSDARFVTRTSAEKRRTARSQAMRPGRGSTHVLVRGDAAVHGARRRAVAELIGAGAVDKVLGARGRGENIAASLEGVAG